MKFRRTDDPDVNFIEADPVWLWSYGIAEFRIDTKDWKFLLTALGRDSSSEGPTVDVTEAWEDFKREKSRWTGAPKRSCAPPASPSLRWPPAW